MQTKHFITGIIMLFFGNHLISQDLKETGPQRFKPINITALIGFEVENSSLYSNKDYYNLAPESEILKNNSYDLNKASFVFDPSLNIGLYTDLKLLNKKTNSYRKNQSLRLGLLYQKRSLSKSYSYSEDVQRKDSTTMNGETLYLDSLSFQGMSAYHYTKELKLDIAYLFNTGDKYLLSLFGGIGAQIGFSHYSSLKNYSHSNEASLYTTKNSEDVFSWDFTNQNTTYTQERNGTKSMFTTAIYTPIGVNLRWSHHHKLYKRIHTGVEVRPQFELISNKELSATKFYTLQYNTYLKFNF